MCGGHINIYDCCLNRNALGHYYSSIWNCIGLVFLTFAGYTHRGRRNVMKYFKMQRRDIGFQNKSMLMRSMDTNAYAVPQLFCMVGYWSVLTTSYYASTPHIKTIAQDAYDRSRTAREKKQRNPDPTGGVWLRLIFMLIKTILGGRQWGYNPAREAILTARGRSLPPS